MLVPLDFTHLKQYTAKVVKTHAKQAGRSSAMAGKKLYFIGAARFYSGRYFVMPVVPS